MGVQLGLTLAVPEIDLFKRPIGPSSAAASGTSAAKGGASSPSSCRSSAAGSPVTAGRIPSTTGCKNSDRSVS